MKTLNLNLNYRTVAGTRKCMELRSVYRKVPGIVYGGSLKENEKILVTADRSELTKLINTRAQSFGSSLVNVTISNEFDPSSEEIKNFKCLPRNCTLHNIEEYPTSCNWMVYDPVKGARVHLPLNLKDTEKCPGLKRGGLVNRQFWYVPCLVKGEEVPLALSVSLEGLEIGDRLRWTDILWNEIPEGTSVECLLFRKESWKKQGLKNLTLLTISGKSQKMDESEKEEDVTTTTSATQ